MHALENYTLRISLYGKDSFHSKDVLALGAQKLGKPAIELLCIATAIALDADACNLIVMMMVMVLVFFFQEVRIDLHSMVKIKAADIEDLR